MKYSKELKIGVFAILVAVAAFFVINYLRGRDVFNKEIELVAHFKSVEGLVASAPVHIRGFAAGQVSSVSYDPERDDFEVVCSVDRKFRIPSDSKMTIYSTSIMGGKGIRIDPGSSEELAGNMCELEGDSQADLVESISAGIGPLLANLDSALAKLNLTVDSVNSVLSEDNRRKIDRAISNLDKAIADASDVSGTISGNRDEIDRFIKDLTAVSGELSTIVGKADSAMDNLDSFSRQLAESEVDSLVTSLKNLSESLQNPEGTVGKLMTDGRVYESVDSLINELNDLISKIKQDPKKYMKISVF